MGEVITKQNGEMGIFLHKQGKQGIMVSVQSMEKQVVDFRTQKTEEVMVTRNEYWKYTDLLDVFQKAFGFIK